MGVTQGTWGWMGPLGYLDFGITEKLGIGGSNPNRAPVIGPQSTNPNLQPGKVMGVNNYVNQSRNPTANYGGNRINTTTPQPTNRLASIPQTPNEPNPDDEARMRAEEEARRWEEETRNAIESGYGSYMQGLGGMQTSLEADREGALTSASKTYEQLFGGLQDQKTANLDKLQAGRGAVQTRQAQSIKDLQQNLANTLRGASMQFGAKGAGDTSATRVMLPYAYTKMAGAEEGSIRKQANEQLFEIDQQEKDTELQFSEMWRQTEVEKESQLQSIRQYYSDALRNVQTAMAQAPLDKSRDLASLSQALLSEAQANLRQLEAETRQRQESIRTWATQRVADLNNLKLSLSGSANFSPQDIVWNELSMAGVTSQTAGNETFYNPLLAQKKREEYLRL